MDKKKEIARSPAWEMYAAAALSGIASKDLMAGVTDKEGGDLVICNAVSLAYRLADEMVYRDLFDKFTKPHGDQYKPASDGH